MRNALGGGYLGGESGAQPLGHLLQIGDGIILKRPILESDVSVERAFLDGLKNVRVVNFAVLQLVSARITGGVEVADFVDIGGNIFNEVSFADLLMIDVKDHLDVRALDFVDDLECLVAAHEVIPGMIDQFVERFDDERDAGIFEERAGFTQSIDQ